MFNIKHKAWIGNVKDKLDISISFNQATNLGVYID